MWFVFLWEIWFHNISDALAAIVLTSRHFSVGLNDTLTPIGGLYLSGTTTADSPGLKADRRLTPFGQNNKGVKKTKPFPLLFVCDSTEL